MQTDVNTLDDVFSQLGLASIEQGELSVFCGAGISINSGLPPANALKQHILSVLTDQEVDVDLLMNARIPFESFMERIFQNYRPSVLDGKVLEYEQKIEDEKDVSKRKLLEAVLALVKLAELSSSNNINSSQGLFLNLFKDEKLKPNANHILIARLARADLLRVVVTTNFDCLIEQACVAEGMTRETDFRVVYDEKEFGQVENEAFRGLIIFKIHGSAEAPDSVRTTLQHVANQKFSVEREKVINYLLRGGSHKHVMVMGYSCSDFFDISPVIEQIKDCEKQVIFVNHVNSGVELVPLVNILDEDSKRVFKHYRGSLVSCRTDDFVQGLWYLHSSSLGDIPPVEAGPRWEELLRPWVDDFSRSSNELLRLFIMSLLLESIAQHRRSIEYLLRGLELASEQKDQSTLVILYSNLASSYGSLGEVASANLYAEKAIQLAGDTNNRSQVAQNIIGLAVNLMMHGKNEEAIQKYLEALQIGEEINSDDIRVTCYSDLANAYTPLDAKKAEMYAIKVIEIAELSPTPAMMKARARTETLLCRIFSAQNNLEDASKHADEAIRLSELLGDEQEVVMAMVSLAATLNDQGKTEAAERYFLKSLPLTQKTGNKLLECVCTFWIGKLTLDYIERRRSYSLFAIQRITKNLNRTIELARELGTTGAAALGVCCLARMHVFLGEFDIAKPMIIESMDVFSKTGETQNYAVCEEMMGIIDRHEQKLKQEQRKKDQLRELIISLQDGNTPAPPDDKKWWQFWKR
jgi:tetratricopeptide (TPR) repeat protein/NAD-dependent SIR2 family protein deacetylase